MEFNSISVTVDGHIKSTSEFFTAHSAVNGSYMFSKGINKLVGEIDCGYWSISYLLSMYDKSDSFVLSDTPKVSVNGKNMSIYDLLKLSCYIDRNYPLFSSHKKIEELVKCALKKSHLSVTASEIRNMFELDKERFNRPLIAQGNEKIRAMSAIAYACGKEVFCFPWFSEKLFSYYRNHLEFLFDILEKENKIVIFPLNSG